MSDLDFTAAAARLAPKERQCLGLVGENRSSKEIARLLGVSHTSVDTHVRRALAKLGVRDRYEAARRLAQLEGPAAGSAGTARESSAFGRRPAAPAAPMAWIFPPLEDLSLARRLTLVGTVAVLMAMVFGIVLNALRMV